MHGKRAIWSLRRRGAGTQKPYRKYGTKPKNTITSERKKVNKVLDFENFYDETDDDDLIDAAEAAFDEYLAECTADYSELCSVRAQQRG